MTDWQKRRDAAALDYQNATDKNTVALVGRRAKPTEALISEDAFADGWDAGRADLMREVEEVLVKALQECTEAKYFNPVANEWQPSVVRNMARAAIERWQKIKGGT